jgi:hypothetical protein
MNLTAGYFGWFQKKPDLQIAYVGSVKLPDDTVASLEQIFASLADDYNGDGSVLVQVNQYVSGSPELSDTETASYRYATEITLIGDINDCESYFFLMESPEDFQRTYQILAMPDGSCPDDLDFSIEGKAFLWSSFDALANADLGSYTTTLLGEETSGENQELLSGLYLGRRCFYNEKCSENAEDCDALWNALKEGLN